MPHFLHEEGHKMGMVFNGDLMMVNDDFNCLMVFNGSFLGFSRGSSLIGDDFLTVLGFDVFAACLARVIVRPTIEAEGHSMGDRC